MRRSAGIAPAALFALAGTVLFTALSGQAAAGDDYGPAGVVTLELSAKAAKKLDRSRVSIRGAGGDREVSLGISSAEVGTLARLEVSDTLRFRSRTSAGRKRKVKVKAIGATVTGNLSQLFGKVAGTQYTLIRLLRVTPDDGRFDPITGQVSLISRKAVLDGQARDRLSSRLGGARLPRKLGRIRIEAAGVPVEVPSEEPPLLERPDSAVDVVDAALIWRTRESFVNYLHASGDQGGTAVRDGAVNGPAEVIPPSSQARVYEFGFPFASGWRDPASGEAAAYFTGTVNFFKLPDPFNIDLDASNAEIELTGDDARAIFTMNGREGNADQQDRRAIAVNLDLGAVAPVVDTQGSEVTRTWTRIPATVPEGADTWPIAGFYLPDDPWGSVSISITTVEGP